MSHYVYFGPALRCTSDLSEASDEVTINVQYYEKDERPSGEWKNACQVPVPPSVWETFRHYGRSVSR